jgi:hypothetical protein
MNVFLAFSFRTEDRPLVRYVEQLLASQLVQVVTGERLGGEQLTPAVKARIEQADALVALLTRRDQLTGGGWTTHDWVKDEIGYARAKGKRAIALVEDGVDVGGMYEPHECIHLIRDTVIDALLILSENVSLWKWERGRTVKVQILPQELAQKIGVGGPGIRCMHRLCLNGKYSEWREATPVPELGGTFVYIEGVQDDQLVQIRVEEPNKAWQSPATAQWLQVQLNSGGINP